MKTGLQLRQGQQLAMTPQLQQAIRLLQLSSLELQQELQLALDSNLMLELEEPEDVRSVSQQDYSSIELGLEGSQSAIPDELPIDTDWSSIYENAPASISSDYRDRADQSFDTFTDVIGESLHEHLNAQLAMLTLKPAVRLVLMVMIDSIDDGGYLRLSLNEIHEQLADDGVTTTEIETALEQLHEFDPPGVGARDLRECLTLQLAQLPATTPYLSDALRLVEDHFDALSQSNRDKLRQVLHSDEQQLAAILHLIRSLNPRPGNNISRKDTEYIEPDVVVTRHKNRWLVRLNDMHLPRLRINNAYVSMIQRGNQSQDNQTLRDHLQEARWLLKSLESRHETLLRVAEEIVKRQRQFLEQGPEAMRPMVMRELADELDMHESTISRTTSRKYMLTPRGLFELKYFFSSHVSTDLGGECSATAIRAMIKKMIHEEQPDNPLSDNMITVQLKAQGIAIARRTVAKYREAMTIPPSSDRKRLL